MQHIFSLGGKKAIITGAAKGVGERIAVVFAQLGADSFLVDIDNVGLKETVQEVQRQGREACSLVADITDLKVLQNLVQNAIEKMGKIDILINNAGIALTNRAEDVTEQEWDRTMAVNLKTVFFLSQYVGKHMIKRRYGKIVNIASQTGIIAEEEHAAYAASKVGVVGLTKVLALEWGKYNINVNSVAPTIILTPMGKRIWSGEKGERMLQKIPIGRFAKPEDVAYLVAFLSSDLSSMMTGTTVMIDGGYTAA